MKKTVLFLVLVFVALGASAQNMSILFDVFFNDKPIGTLSATKIKLGNKINKIVKSNTDTKVLMLNIHVETEVNTISENEILEKATSYRNANHGKENIKTTVAKLNTTDYHVIKNGEHLTIKSPGIKYCVVDLYFTEPKGIKEAFSSTHGQFLKITPKGNGAYILSLPDGKTNIMTYQSGKLMQVEASVAVGSILFKRK